MVNLSRRTVPFGKGAQVIILVAAGVEVSPVTFCAERLRDASLDLSLISLTPSPVRGKHGILFCTDGLIRSEQPIIENSLIILPGTQECIQKLMRDPRVHELIDKVWEAQGVVAVMNSAETVAKKTLTRYGIHPQLWLQGDCTLEQFVAKLIHFAKTTPHLNASQHSPDASTSQ